MAKTYPKQALRVFAPNDAFLGAVSEYYPEGATQTFVANSPVVFTGGYIVESAQAPSVGVSGIALTAGNNSVAAGTYDARVVPVTQNIGIYANFLGAAGVDNVLAATDLGLDRDLYYLATLLGAASPGWYIADSAGGAVVNIRSFRNDWPYPNSIESEAEAGDTNARVSAIFLNAAVLPFA